MRIPLGAQVLTSDGQDMGTVDRLILDPTTHDVKAAVVRKGTFLTRDVAIPIEAIQVGADDQARVSYSADRVDDLPEFYESNYTDIPPMTYVPMAGYPAAGLYWPAAYAYGATAATYPGPLSDEESAEQRQEERRLNKQDLENAVIGEGSLVRDRAGESAGEVHSLMFDENSGELSGFVVRKGLIFTEDMHLPAALIQSVDDGLLYLSVTKDWLDGWSRLEPGWEVRDRDAAPLGTVTQRQGSALTVTSLDESRTFLVPAGAIAEFGDGQIVLSATREETTRW